MTAISIDYDRLYRVTGTTGKYVEQWSKKYDYLVQKHNAGNDIAGGTRSWIGLYIAAMCYAGSN